jgi:nucleotide-binding universal stress UspA family protein
VTRALRHQAERWHADLVIVGSNPSAPTGHVAISRRGRQLLYDAPFSLAIAARGFHERSMEVSSIGVGYEDGPEAQEALAVAGGLAHVTNATLRVHRVVEELVPPLTIERVDRELWEPQRRTALAAAEAAASHFGVPTDVSASIGDPGYELRALSEDVDLLVVGSRRWGPVARLVSGGVGETLVADASCSILIVPRPPARRGRDAGQPREHRAVVA